MRRVLRTSILGLLAALTISGSLFAQAAGRVQIIAQDTSGEPLKGVQITVTCDELPQFFLERETSKKGKSTLTFVDGTKVYNFEFKFEDFPPQSARIKPQIGGVEIRTITLDRSAVAGAQVREQVSFTPSEKKFNEGVGYLQQSDWASAKQRFEEALKIDPEMAAAYSAIAAAYIELGEYQSALDAANRFMEIEGEHPRGYRLLYETYNRMGDKEQADDALKKLSKLDSGGDAVTLVYNEGVSAFKVGDYKAARGKFEEALELDPKLAPALAALARIYLADSNYSGAAEMAERMLAEDPEDRAIMKVRIDAYRGLGDAEKEKAAFDALAAADPRFLAAELYVRGAELFDGGEIDAAQAELERVLSIDPTHAKAHYRLALCYVNNEQSSLAREHLQKFIELAPDDPEAAVAKDMLSFL